MDKDNLIKMSLKGKIKEIPKDPGCYKFFDKHNNIIYIGKSKNLYNRVKSYFYNHDSENKKLIELVSKIVDLEYNVVDTELNALILEYIMIKKYKPWFNSQMKPDKIRPYLKIAIEEPYPTLSSTNEDVGDISLYYSHFSKLDDVIDTLKVFSKIWKTPLCNKNNFKNISRPCLYYFIGDCVGPCIKSIEESAYREKIVSIQNFLERKDISVLEDLKNSMKRAADELRFEDADKYKYLLEKMEKIHIMTKNIYNYPKNKDIIVSIRPYKEKNFSVFHIRNERVINRMDIEGSIDNEKIYKTLKNIKSRTIKNSKETAKALLAIYAEKRFYVVKKMSDLEGLSKRIDKFI